MTALATDFRPPFWLKNPHLQTILPRYVVNHTPDYTRHLIKDSLNESQVAFDYFLSDDSQVNAKYQKPLAVWRCQVRCFITQVIRRRFIII